MGYHDTGDPAIDAFRRYSRCMARVTVKSTAGDLVTGSAFHVGDGWFVTARHVIEAGEIVEIEGYKYHAEISLKEMVRPTDELVDLALLSTDFDLSIYMSDRHQIRGVPNEWKRDYIEIGGHLDDWIGDELVLGPVLMMGYPRVARSKDSVLIAVTGQVNAVVDEIAGVRHPYFLISPMPRGGFSGGPVIMHDFLLGVVTGTFHEEPQVPELGFAAALTVEPLWNLLDERRVYPGNSGEFMKEDRLEWEAKQDAGTEPVDEARPTEDKKKGREQESASSSKSARQDRRSSTAKDSS